MKPKSDSKRDIREEYSDHANDGGLLVGVREEGEKM